MKFEIELFHPELTGYKLFVNHTLKSEGSCDGKILLSVTENGDCEIWFEPWKIQPKVRINNFLIDFFLAEINLYDHKFDVEINKDFFKRYRKNDLKSREDSIFPTGAVHDPYIYDSVIGVGNLYEDIAEEIKKVLDIE